MARSARKRRNEGAKHDQSGLGHELGDFADAADVFDPVDFGKAQILVEPMPDIVAIEQDGMDAMRVKPRFDQIGDRRFARAGEAGEPQHGGLVMLDPGAVMLGDVQPLAVDIGRPAQPKRDQRPPPPWHWWRGRSE